MQQWEKQIGIFKKTFLLNLWEAFWHFLSQQKKGRIYFNWIFGRKKELLWFFACFKILVRVFKNLYNINLWYGGFTLHNELHFKQRPLKIFLLKHSRGGELLRLTIAESNSCDCLKDRTTQQFSHQTDKQRNVQTVWGDVFPPKLWMSKQPHWSSAKIKNCLGMAKNPYVLFFFYNSYGKVGLLYHV